MSTVLESLNAGLHGAMEADERVYIIGEDVLDPYGAAFKATPAACRPHTPTVSSPRRYPRPVLSASPPGSH